LNLERTEGASVAPRSSAFAKPYDLKQLQKLLFYLASSRFAYDHRISTGPLEGTNNKIKTMKRQAYGFRDTEFLKLKIMGIHTTRHALVG
jgi:hypothetical protein